MDGQRSDYWKYKKRLVYRIFRVLIKITDKGDAETRRDKWIGRLEILFVGMKTTDANQMPTMTS